MRPPRRRAAWTLRAQLVAGTAVVVGAALVAVITVSAISLNATADAVVDTQLTASASALERSIEKYRGHDSRGPESGQQAAQQTDQQAAQEEAKGFAKPLAEFTGQAPGSVIAIVQGGTVVDSAWFSGDTGVVPSAAVLQQISEAADAGAGTSELDLAELGHYRVAVLQGEGDEMLVSAVSMVLTDGVQARQAIMNVLVSVLAIVMALIGAAILGRLLFRSMGRVVGVAETVIDTPLDSGEGGIAVRVAPEDADPRTDIGKLGEAMNRLLEHVDSALAVRAATDRRMRRFVTDVSHELRTPLAAIQGYAELTRQESELLPETTEYSLARIESEAQRMNSLVSELLLLARLDEGHDLQLEELDLADLVDTAVNDARATHPEHDWRSAVPEGAVMVLGDRERLHQLVVNLLSNAGRHTPAGTTVTARIVAAASAGGAVELVVADTGPGIEQALMPVLFERFVRADSARTRQTGGTGLGLAIAHSIVEAHGGSITVSSSQAGAAFSVLLPGVIRLG